MSVPATIEFTCETGGKSESRAVQIDNLVIAGWTGRDRDAVEKHIAADPDRAKAFLMRASLIASVRRAETLA